MTWIDCHKAPNQEDIAKNVATEPEGERIRAELVAFLKRNKIVSVLLDTEEHYVHIDIVKLPPEIKPVLTCWGSIFIRNEPPPPPVVRNSCNRHSDCKAADEKARAKGATFGASHCHDDECEDCFGC